MVRAVPLKSAHTKKYQKQKGQG